MVFKRTNDCPAQPEEPGYPEVNPKTALFPKTFKLWVKKPYRVVR